MRKGSEIELSRLSYIIPMVCLCGLREVHPLTLRHIHGSLIHSAKMDTQKIIFAVLDGHTFAHRPCDICGLRRRHLCVRATPNAYNGIAELSAVLIPGVSPTIMVATIHRSAARAMWNSEVRM